MTLRVRIALALWLTVSAGVPLAAQGPTTSQFISCPSCTRTSTPPAGAGAGALPPNSPWLRLGAQLGYKIAGSGEFADDFLVSARTEIQRLNFGQGPAFKIPVIGNFAPLRAAFSNGSSDAEIQKLLNTAEGINLSLQPYFEASGSGARIQTTFYGNAGWKLNAAKQFDDSTKTVYVNQWRISAGISFNAFVVESPSGTANPLPVQLTVEPVYTIVPAQDFRRAFGHDKGENLTSLELTGIAPIGLGMGLLAQSIVADGVSPVWRVGLLFFKQDEPAQTTPAAPNVTPPPPTPVSPSAPQVSPPTTNQPKPAGTPPL